MNLTWLGILVGGLACYAIKVAGLTVPSERLANHRMQRIVAIVPTGLLASLVVLQTVTTGAHLVIDARLAALAAAGVALWRRAPFLIVVAVATATAAGLRLLS